MDLKEQTSSVRYPKNQEKSARSQVRWGPPFWTIMSIVSLLVNAVLLAIVIGLGSQIFTIKEIVNEQLLAGLAENFAAMDQAHIQATIPVRDQTVRASFDLHIETETEVVLSQDVTISDAQILSLNTGGLAIYNAPADIQLPAGTRLPINLTLDVPVDQEIPVNLDVAVDIPLSESDLHEPLTGLQDVVNPYIELLDELPDSWVEVFCGKEPADLCAWFFTGRR